MKNREKFAKEILDIVCKGKHFGVTKSGEITFCDLFKCDMCKFNDSTGEKNCRTKRYEWSESEYVEKPIITSREKSLLDVLLPSCKYIARDNNNELYIYNEKPTRSDCDWYLNDGILCRISTRFFGNMFDFIKCEDEKPWSVEDLKKLEVRDE